MKVLELNAFLQQSKKNQNFQMTDFHHMFSFQAKKWKWCTQKICSWNFEISYNLLPEFLLKKVENNVLICQRLLIYKGKLHKIW